MSKSNYLENAYLGLIFNATAIADLAENDTTTPATSLYVALHTADPTEAGDATSNEAAYTSYARVAVARSGAGWTVSGNSVVNAAAITFPTATGGSETITHFSITTAASGASVLLYIGPLSASLPVSTSVQPSFNAGALTVTED